MVWDVSVFDNLLLIKKISTLSEIAVSKSNGIKKKTMLPKTLWIPDDIPVLG